MNPRALNTFYMSNYEITKLDFTEINETEKNKLFIKIKKNIN